MVDTLFIKGLKASGVIGVFEAERTAPQEILIDVEIELDLSRAGKSDDIEDSLSYKTVADLILDIAATSKRYTVEALAEDIAARCLSFPQAEKVAVSVSKPAALENAHTAGVRIERSRAQID